MKTRGQSQGGADAKRIKWIRLRTLLLGLAFVPAVAALMLRAIKLQALQAGQMHQLAEEQYRDEEAVPPRRGTITDRNGSPLAASVDVDSVAVDPLMFRADASRVSAVARALNLDPREVSHRVERPVHFTWLKRGATPDEVAAMKGLALDGVSFIKEPRRFYPQRSLAANLLGLAGVDGQGIEGLELAYDAQLKGRKGAVDVIRDAQRRTVFADGITDPQTSGAALTLTLDRSIQHITEVALAEAAAKTECASAMAVVMAPETGEILALADWPTFNPNDPVRDERALRDRAVVDAFEPGSTMKSVMMAAALEEKVVHPSDPISCESGHYAIGNRTIHDHEPFGTLTATQVITHSSNIGAAKIAQRLGPDRLNAYYRLFGFGEKTGIGLPGEVRGSIPYPRAAIQVATQAFGQGMTANALQLVAAYGAIANGGTLMRPYVVKKVVDADGAILETHGAEPIRQVMSPKTAAALTSMLETVVTKEGTAPLASMDEYQVAGKTGTAQKADPDTGGYSADRRTASFIGFVPADRPRLVIAVIIDEPKGDKYGGKVAAPAFKEIALQALPLLGVPSAHGPNLQPVLVASASVPPQIDDAEDGISDDGTGGVQGRSVVPDFTGMGARSVARAAAAADLQPEMEGTGRAVAQTPQPGTVMPSRSRVSVRLESRL